MKNFQHIGTADTLPLLHQLTRQPKLWRADTYLRDYPQGPFGDCETVFIRFPPASVTELQRTKSDPHECVWMDGAAHLPAARKIIFDLAARTEAERIGRVMVNKLKMGGRIFAHADTPEHANYWDRYHVVLQSTPGAEFRCGEERIYMAPGNVWWFDNAIEHEAVNNGAAERIHLIIDLRHSEGGAGVTPTTVPLL